MAGFDPTARMAWSVLHELLSLVRFDTHRLGILEIAASVDDLHPLSLANWTIPPANRVRMDSFQARSFARSIEGGPKVMPRCSDSRAALTVCAA